MKPRTRFKISETEAKHIALALLALSFSFEFILFREEIFVQGLFTLVYLVKFFLQSLVAVGFAFVLHELGHKFMAESKGLWAEFRAWPAGLLLAMGLAVFSKGGFVFAAPGATMISPLKRTKAGLAAVNLDKSDIGHIGIIGSVINVALALSFGLVALLTGFEIAKITAQVNAWLALFNMIPFSLLDGAKVWFWNKGVWVGFFLLCIAIFGLTALL